MMWDERDEGMVVCIAGRLNLQKDVSDLNLDQAEEPQPLLKRVNVVEYVGQDEVEQGPEFGQVILIGAEAINKRLSHENVLPHVTAFPSESSSRRKCTS